MKKLFLIILRCLSLNDLHTQTKLVLPLKRTARVGFDLSFLSL